jgi:hypothetical protein
MVAVGLPGLGCGFWVVDEDETGVVGEDDAAAKVDAGPRVWGSRFRA